MDSSNFDNHSKAPAFKRFKLLLYKYYLKFSKICKNNGHLNQFLVLVYDVVPNESQKSIKKQK